MQISELTPEVVTPIIRQIVEEFGEDYVYKEAELHDPQAHRMCYYRENDKTPCIVGHVLDRSGEEYDENWEGHTAFTLLTGCGAPTEVAIALTEAQEAQDIGKSWGHALKEYEKALAEYQ